MTSDDLGAAIADALRGSCRAEPPPLAVSVEHLGRLVHALLAGGTAGLVFRRLDPAALELAPARAEMLMHAPGRP